MVTINPSEAFAVPRAYVVGYACFGRYDSVSLEGGLIIITDELGGRVISFKIHSKINTSSPWFPQLKDFIQDATVYDEVTRLTTEFDCEVGLVWMETEGEFRVAIHYSPLVVLPALINLPAPAYQSVNYPP